ncbi:MAG TPA: glycosyltransferase [Candidatus Scatovivens faecipullorum]|nr:glycosyltransferase [Candidatus Scatovivens faecipullorum]
MSIRSNIEKVKFYIKRYGFFSTFKKVFKRIFKIKENRKTNQEAYQTWMEKNTPNEDELEKQKTTKFTYAPKISVVVPMYNTDEKFFQDLIESLNNQTYANWELCLADGSPKKNENLEKYYEKNKKIKYNFLGKNEGISENTNEAIKMATGDYVGFLDHDDILSEEALFQVVKVINQDLKTDFIYTDEDKIDENYERFEPYFKPDYSPETLECNNYITHFVVVKKEIIEKIGKLNSEFNGAQDFDFVLRATKVANKITHISKVLYHWRVHKNSTAYIADTKNYAFEAGKKVIEADLKREGKSATVEFGQEVPGIYKIKYEVIGNPKVSILIPNKDNIKLLKKCITSILKFTTYENYEINIIENNSEKKETFKYYEELVKNSKIKILNFNKHTVFDINGEKSLENKTLNKDLEKNNIEKNIENIETKENELQKVSEFNYSALINFGVKNVDAEFVLQLNNDTKLITKDWLELFIGYAQNSEIGAVGARLYYEDKTIQHAGIIVGVSGIAGNALVNLPYGKHAYFGREAATRNVLAVTGACLFARRSLYYEVGFMDEKEFKVAFNDVDFCLKLYENGYRNVYNPYIELIHYESKSRGYEISEEKEERFEKEANNFKRKWSKYIKYDPYYNKNLSRKTVNYDIVE